MIINGQLEGEKKKKASIFLLDVSDEKHEISVTNTAGATVPVLSRDCFYSVMNRNCVRLLPRRVTLTADTHFYPGAPLSVQCVLQSESNHQPIDQQRIPCPAVTMVVTMVTASMVPHGTV